ncbi:MAG: NAD(P)-dependent oxidoreductase [Ktedonobacterales bacterium]
MKIAVVGSTGRTGRLVLDQAVRPGHQVTAFSRRPQELQGIQGLHPVVRGDGLNRSDVLEVVRAQDCVISILSTPGLGPSSVVTEVTSNIIGAMHETGVRRLICTSSHSLVATRPWLIVKAVKWIFRNPYADVAIMERAVAASNLDWTIVRATQLTDGAATGHMRRAHGDFDTGPYTIRRADLATALLDIAESGDEIRAAVEVSGATTR